MSRTLVTGSGERRQLSTSLLRKQLSSPLNAAEGVLIPLFGLDLKVKRTRRGGASGEVDTGDLLEP